MQFDTLGSRSGRRRISVQLNVNTSTNTVSVNNFTASGNLTVNADLISVGNSSVNVIINSTSVTVGNVIANTTQLSIGTGTSNVYANSIAVVVPVGAGANAITTPAAANTLAFYGKYKAGKVQPMAIDGSGWDTPLEAHSMHNSVYYILPIINAAATFSTARLTAVTSTITSNNRTLASTNTFLQSQRVTMATNTTTTQVCGITINQAGGPFWRGNAAGLGGFYMVQRFGVAVKAANGVFFAGLSSSNAFPVVNSTVGHLSAQTNIIGFGVQNNFSNLVVVSANNTVANTIDTGLDIATGNTNWYEAVVFAPPNGGTVQYQITNLTNNFTVSGQYNQTNLPATTQFLVYKTYASNKDTAAIMAVDWGGVQIEVPL